MRFNKFKIVSTFYGASLENSLKMKAKVIRFSYMRIRNRAMVILHSYSMSFPDQNVCKFPVPKLVAPAGARYHGTGMGHPYSQVGKESRAPTNQPVKFVSRTKSFVAVIQSKTTTLCLAW
jgi:hypothetical protein